jgi:serine/threonine protein kinase
MLDLDPEDLLKEERENIMRKTIEADYTLRYAGVQHDDISPGNIIITTTTAFSSPDLRLTLVDFGFSTVYDILYDGPALPAYNNPLFHWTSADLWSSWGWLPADEERVEWMWRVWADGCEGKYVKVEKDPDNIFGAPKEPELGECDGSEEVKESA